jgi:hypothetical protein
VAALRAGEGCGDAVAVLEKLASGGGGRGGGERVVNDQTPDERLS